MYMDKYKFTANRIDSRVRDIKQASMNMFKYTYDKTMIIIK
jgi:hypothetical protein